jgi:metal-sulfur cluster biosynthetic enzyme
MDVIRREVSMDNDILLPLKQVIDPELGINVVDLGLVRKARHGPDGIEVVLSMTSPSCPLGELMAEQAEAILRTSFPAAASIRVDLARDARWSPDLMSEEARRQLRTTS